MSPLSARARPPLADVLLGCSLAAVALGEAATEQSVQHPVLHATVGATALVAIAWRRRFPFAISILVLGASILLAANGGEFSVVFGLVVMAFTLGAESEGLRSRVGVLAFLGFFLTALVVDNRGIVAGDLGAGLVLIALPWVAGRTLREQARGLAAVLTRAERLEEEKQLEARAAVARERTRLARELHDVVSHSLSVITIQVQAVRRRTEPDHPRDAADLAAVEDAARDALTEMRRLLGVLRDDGEPPDLAPQPGLGELERLVDRVREGGIDVALHTRGEVVDLSPGLDLAAYRIVQEAVTNALRHSGARHVRVELHYGPGELRVSVEDDGRGLEAADPGGHGLRGARERAELYGGSLEIGPGVHGGVRLHARLPVGSPA